MQIIVIALVQHVFMPIFNIAPPATPYWAIKLAKTGGKPRLSWGFLPSIVQFVYFRIS